MEEGGKERGISALSNTEFIMGIDSGGSGAAGLSLNLSKEASIRRKAYAQN